VSCIKVDQWGIVNVANHPSVSVWWFVAMGNLASHVYNIIFLNEWTFRPIKWAKYL